MAKRNKKPADPDAKGKVKVSWENFFNKKKGASETEIMDMSIEEISAVLRCSRAVIYETSNHMLYRQDADDIRWMAERLFTCGVRLSVLSSKYEGTQPNKARHGAQNSRLSHLVGKKGDDDS